MKSTKYNFKEILVRVVNKTWYKVEIVARYQKEGELTGRYYEDYWDQVIVSFEQHSFSEEHLAEAWMKKDKVFKSVVKAVTKNYKPY